MWFAHHNWWLQCRTLNPLLVRIHPHSNCFPTLILVVLRAWPIAHQHQLATVLTSRLCELQSQKITMEGDFGNVPTTSGCNNFRWLPNEVVDDKSLVIVRQRRKIVKLEMSLKNKDKWLKFVIVICCLLLMLNVIVMNMWWSTRSKDRRNVYLR
uniref:Transmembrane protein n=1 Tax=Glycine max TaxID=3847 RepID=A0A0R0H4R4_SOYBN